MIRKIPAVVRWLCADNLPYEKVEKNEPVCIADEVPFEIPESWEWVHLSDIAISGLGKTLNKSIDEGTDTPYLCSINVYWTGIDLSTVKTAKFTQTDRDKYLLRKGDLLICEGGDVGRSAIWNYDREMYYQNALHRVRFLDKINPYFFLYLLEYYKSLKIIEEYSKGVTIKHFVQSSLNAMFLPLPPLNEQQRIVDKINEIMPIVTKYDTTYSKVAKLNETFPEALKRSILQWAVQGKLVPQDPSDEPASILLERIREEKQRLIKEGKIKKDKHESVIFRRDNSHYEKLDGIERCIDDELPFEIPKSWCWCKIGSIFTLQAGKNIQSAEIHENPFPGSYPCYGGNGIRGYVAIANRSGNYPIIGRQGALCGNINLGTGKFYATEHAICVEIYSNVSVTWTCLFLAALNLNQYATATAQPGLAVANINEVFIPLPPLNEQHRIVQKIEELLLLIKGL